MSNVFLGLLGLALTGLIYIGYKYFHTKMLEREAAAKEKIEALMDAYRQQKKGKGSKDPDLDELTEQVEVLPAVPGESLYWRKFWYIGLAVVAVLAALWITVPKQQGVEGKNLSRDLTEPAATDMEDAEHHDENDKARLNSNEQAAELELLKMSHSHYDKQVVINGLVRNISQDTLNNVSVVILFEDGNEDFLTSAQGRLIYTMLLPGEDSPFKVETIEDHSMVSYRVSFRNREGAPVRYEDVRESGNDDYINPPAKENKHEEDEEEGHHETG